MDCTDFCLAQVPYLCIWRCWNCSVIPSTFWEATGHLSTRLSFRPICKYTRKSDLNTFSKQAYAVCNAKNILIHSSQPKKDSSEVHITCILCGTQVEIWPVPSFMKRGGGHLTTNSDSECPQLSKPQFQICPGTSGMYEVKSVNGQPC